MSKERGGLMLSRDNQVGVSGMSSINTGSILEHEKGAVLTGAFPITIPDRMAESMTVVGVTKGEAVAFDSLEPHMSGPNVTSTPRLAMKIAYAEGKEKTQYLTRTDTLEHSP